MRNNHLFRLLAVLVAALGFAEGLRAQQYETDGLLTDSVAFRSVTLRDSAYIRADEWMLVPNGETVELLGKTADGEAVVLYMETHYAANPHDLRFGKNAEGVENTLQDKMEQRRHTFIGHMFYTSFPYILIFVLLVLTGFCMLLVNKFVKKEPWTTRLLIAIPCGLLLATLLEAWAYLTIGGDIGWWCDPDRLGFGRSLEMAAPLAIAFSIQVLVGLAYKRNVERVADADISWRITKALGKRLAMLFIFFSIIYAVSLFVAVVVTLVIALKIILTVLVYLTVIALAIYLFALAGGSKRRKKVEEKKEEMPEEPEKEKLESLTEEKKEDETKG